MPLRPLADPTGSTAEEAGHASLFDQRVALHYDRLQPAAQRVVRHISGNRLTVLSTSAADLARRAGASDATVVRAVQGLGFKGLSDLRQALAVELSQDSNPAENMRRTAVDMGEGVEHAVASVIDTHLESLREIANPEVQAVLVRAISLLHGAQRILIFGIGPSASLSEYAAMLLNRHGHAARAINATGNGLADQLLDLRAGDALLILAYGRTYPEVLVVFNEARQLRLPIVLVTDSLESKLARQADVIVPARRGRQGRVAMHGTTLVVLEAIILGLAFASQDSAMQSLARIGDLRQKLHDHS